MKKKIIEALVLASLLSIEMFLGLELFLRWIVVDDNFLVVASAAMFAMFFLGSMIAENIIYDIIMAARRGRDGRSDTHNEG